MNHCLKLKCHSQTSHWFTHKQNTQVKTVWLYIVRCSKNLPLSDLNTSKNVNEAKPKCGWECNTSAELHQAPHRMHVYLKIYSMKFKSEGKLISSLTFLRSSKPRKPFSRIEAWVLRIRLRMSLTSMFNTYWGSTELNHLNLCWRVEAGTRDRDRDRQHTHKVQQVLLLC